MFTAYNLRRIINIIGIDELKKYLESAFSFVFGKMALPKLFLGKMSASFICRKTDNTFPHFGANRLYLTQSSMVEMGF